MSTIATATPADMLRLYRSDHTIRVVDGRCVTDGIRVFALRNGTWRHRADDIERLLCPLCGPGLRPSHNASPRCESGGRNHCSCDVCF